MENLEKNDLNVKNKVMGDIRCGKLRILCPAAVLARKLGFESALVFSIIWGAFFVSVFLYFLKKTKLFKFIGLGLPGLKVFLATLPYDYIALFILSIIVAVYFANKLDVGYEKKIPENTVAAILLFFSVLVGLFFVLAGVQDVFHGWSKNKIPHNNAIVGRIIEFSPREVLVEEEDGSLVRVRTSVDIDPIDSNANGDFRGKFMRAVGIRDTTNPSYFRAENVLCCDGD